MFIIQKNYIVFIFATLSSTSQSIIALNFASFEMTVFRTTNISGTDLQYEYECSATPLDDQYVIAVPKYDILIKE